MAEIKIAWTALDARKVGFASAVIDDACRAIDYAGLACRRVTKDGAGGVKRIQSGDVA